MTLIATRWSLPETWRFDTWAVIKTIEGDFGQWVRGQLILGIRGRLRHLRRAHRAQPVVPDLWALRSPAVGHRQPVRARPDIIGPIHLGRAGRAAGGHGQSRPHVLAALLLYFAVQQVENNFLGAENPGRRGPAPPGGGRLHDRRWRNPRPGCCGAILALPVTAAFRDVVPLASSAELRRGSRRRWPPRSARWEWDRPMPDAINRTQGPPGATRRRRTRSSPQAALRRLARKSPPESRGDARSRGPDVGDRDTAWGLMGDPAARTAFDRSGTATPDTRRGGDKMRAPASRPRQARPRVTRAAVGDRARRGPRRPIGWLCAGARDRVAPTGLPGRREPGSSWDEGVHKAQGHGAAGPTAVAGGRRSINFRGTRASQLGEVARHDLEYIEWLDRAPIGRNYRQGVNEILRLRRACASQQRARRPTGTGCTASTSCAQAVPVPGLWLRLRLGRASIPPAGSGGSSPDRSAPSRRSCPGPAG